jgi:predicted nuclease with TOPRIM domain
VEQQQGQIEALRSDLKAANDAVKAKEQDVSALNGKVIQIRSHALKLEEELRALRSGEVSNVHRVSEIREELELAQETAGVLLDEAYFCPVSLILSRETAVRTIDHSNLSHTLGLEALFVSANISYASAGCATDLQCLLDLTLVLMLPA